jgi:hypothetical protein
MEEWPPICKVGANIFNKQSLAAKKKWPPNWGLKEVLATHHKKLPCYKYTCERQKARELTLGCNAISHHEVQDSTNTSSRGESLLRLQMGTELHIPIRGIEPTFLGLRRQEVTKITICIQGVTNMMSD